MRDLRYGIEIEMTGLSRGKAAETLAGFFGTRAEHTGGGYDAYAVRDAQGRVWKLVSDGSIQTQKKVRGQTVAADSTYSVELVSPVCVYEDIGTIQEIVRALRRNSALVNDSCGIHVHVGAEKFDAQHLRNITNIMASKEELIYKALQVDLNRSQDYCRRVEQRFLRRVNEQKPQSLDRFKSIWYNGRDGSNVHYHASRYHALNLHSVFQKGTVEFRMFNSTLHAGKVKTYIQFSLAIANQALTQRNARAAPTRTTNDRYTFRTWLLRLGMIGPEFETARFHLLSHLEGNIAWRDPSQLIREQEEQTQHAPAQEPVPAPGLSL